MRSASLASASFLERVLKNQIHPPATEVVRFLNRTTSTQEGRTRSSRGGPRHYLARMIHHLVGCDEQTVSLVCRRSLVYADVNISLESKSSRFATAHQQFARPCHTLHKQSPRFLRTQKKPDARAFRLMCALFWARYPQLPFHLDVVANTDGFMNHPG